MELSTVTTPAQTKKKGMGQITVTAGQTLKIETSPEGSEILNVECPAGKKWSGTVEININETDA